MTVPSSADSPTQNSSEPSVSEVATLAHELRSTLQAIQLIADQLIALQPKAPQPQEPGEEESQVDQRNLLQALQAAVTDGTTTVNAHLRSSGAAPSVACPGDRTAVVEDPSVILARQVAIAKPIAAAKGLGLVSQLPAPGQIIAGPLAQALILIARNLISNALRYTDRGTVTVALEASNDELKLAVTDTGRGISPADQLRVFERGYQVTTLADAQPGGYGLALARSACLRAGGALSVSSDGQTGSHFVARLPIKPVRPANEGKPKILVADDATSVRELLGLIIEAEGYAPTLVGDGKQALQAVQNEDFAAVILDGEMPGLSGTEIAEAIACWQPQQGPRPVVIALSGRMPVRPELFDVVWRKPISRNEIAACLNAELQTRLAD